MLTTQNARGLISNAPQPKERIMQVEITRATVANGGPQAIGTKLDLPEAEAQYLINLKKAVPVGDKAPAPEHREAEVEETATTRTSKKKK